MIKIHLDTDDGKAIIASKEEFNTLGPYAIAGPGKELAREWIENAYGAFGHSVGTYAAPCDLHCAAMKLKQEPEDSVRFVKFEGEVKQYDAWIPPGAVA